MSIHSFFHLTESGRSIAAAGLILLFLLGLFLGAWCSVCASESISPLMRAVVSSRVSIVGLLSSLALPLLLSALAVFIGQPLLLIPIAFCKAFSFSFLGCGLLTAWNSAGWLIAGLLLFPSECAMSVLCWYWLRQLCRPGFRPVPLCIAAGGLILIGILNQCLILPFLAVIITF